MSKIITFITIVFLSFPSFALEAGDLKNKLPDDKVLGKPSAKVTLIEYASLSCAHCASFHNEVLPVIQKKYIDTGKVRLIFRDFPLNAPAFAGSQIAHCAAKQGGDEKYYALLKAMFAAQKEWAFDKDFQPKLLSIAKNEGVDEKLLIDCLNSKEFEDKVLNARKDASEKLEVDSTPSFFINGEKADGIKTAEDLSKALDTVLSGKSLSQEAKEAAKKITTAKTTDMIIGQDKAKVTIVEYANIACPHCGQFHNALVSALQKDYIDTGKVKLVFRELPMNPASFYAFMVAHCKGKSEYFNILTKLIDETESWVSTQAFLPPLRAAAEKAGISKDEFYACLENKESEAHIMGNANESMKILGIKHSPAVYINGEHSEEFNSPDAIREAVEKALKGKN